MSRKFQESLKEVFKGLKEVSMKLLRAFEGYFKNHEEISLGVSSEIYECYKGDLRVFQGSFKDISKKLRKFQGYFYSFSGKFKGRLMCNKCLPKKVSLLQKEGLIFLKPPLIWKSIIDLS